MAAPSSIANTNGNKIKIIITQLWAISQTFPVFSLNNQSNIFFISFVKVMSAKASLIQIVCCAHSVALNPSLAAPVERCSFSDS
jgi:hypothetical protein